MRNFPFDRPGQFYKGNLHCHSANSDGLVPPCDVARAYQEHGYDFVAITDHFIERYGYPISDTRDLWTEDFTTLIGAEFHGPRLQNGVIWDMLAIGLPFDFAPRRIDESFVEMAARAHAAGAWVAIPHPNWNGVVHSDAMSLIESVSAVEIYNHGHMLDSDRGNGWMLADSISTAGHRISTFAADDAHFKTDRPDRFGGWIHLKAESLDSDALLRALKAGEYYSSTGLQIHHVEIEPDQIIVECSPAAGIMLAGMGTVRRYVRGHDLTSARFPREPFENGFFRVTIADERGKRAWSNPIWFDTL